MVLLSLTSDALWVGLFLCSRFYFLSFCILPFLCFPTLVGKVLAKHGAGVEWMPVEWLFGYPPFCDPDISYALILWLQKPQLPSLCSSCDYLDADPASLCHLLKNLLTQKSGWPRKFHRRDLPQTLQHTTSSLESLLYPQLGGNQSFLPPFPQLKTSLSPDLLWEHLNMFTSYPGEQ